MSNSITYHDASEFRRSRKGSILMVKLDGRIVGQIVEVENGFQYFPKNWKHGGEIFSTIKEVQTSLEEK